MTAAASLASAPQPQVGGAAVQVSAAPAMKENTVSVPMPAAGEMLGDFFNRIPSHYTRHQISTNRYGQPTFHYVDPYGPEGDFILALDGDTFTVTPAHFEEPAEAVTPVVVGLTADEAELAVHCIELAYNAMVTRNNHGDRDVARNEFAPLADKIRRLIAAAK